jgi:hypothetical protein
MSYTVVNFISPENYMPFAQEIVNAGIERSGGRCECSMSRCGHGVRCRRPIKNLAPPLVRHRRAITSGGDDSLSNCEVVCKACWHQSGEDGGEE